jgi:hypothetical protein
VLWSIASIGPTTATRDHRHANRTMTTATPLPRPNQKLRKRFQPRSGSPLSTVEAAISLSLQTCLHRSITTFRPSVFCCNQMCCCNMYELSSGRRTRERLDPNEPLGSFPRKQMRQRWARAWPEYSGLAGEPTSADSRVESRASTEQQSDSSIRFSSSSIL